MHESSDEEFVMTEDEVKRIDAELDRLRWYVSRLVPRPVSPDRIAEALKTGDASIKFLRGETTTDE